MRFAIGRALWFAVSGVAILTVACSSSKDVTVSLPALSPEARAVNQAAVRQNASTIGLLSDSIDGKGVPPNASCTRPSQDIQNRTQLAFICTASDSGRTQVYRVHVAKPHSNLLFTYDDTTADVCFNFPADECIVQGLTNTNHWNKQGIDPNCMTLATPSPMPTGVTIQSITNDPACPASSGVNVTIAVNYAPTVGSTFSMSFPCSYTDINGLHSCGAITTTWQVLCNAVSSTPDCPILAIKDVDLNKIITGSPPPAPPPSPLTQWLVGLNKRIKVELSPGSGAPGISYGSPSPIYAYSKSFDTVIAASYGFGIGGNPVVSPSPVGSPDVNGNLQFYWEAGSNISPQNIEAQAEFKGVNGSGQVVEEAVPLIEGFWLVYTPSVSPNVTFQPVQVGQYQPMITNPELSLGTQLNLLHGSAGITTTITGTSPTAIPSYPGGGYFGIAQIITSDTYNPPPFPIADGCPLQMTIAKGTELYPNGDYPDFGYNYYAGPGATPNPLAVIDAPADPLPFDGSGSPFSASETFTDYLMFRPRGTSANWVSLGNYTITWGGTAVSTGGVWGPVQAPVNPSFSFNSANSVPPVYGAVQPLANVPYCKTPQT